MNHLKKYLPPGKHRINKSQLLYSAFLICILLVYSVQPVFAAATMWDKASEIMKDVYNQIVLISTIAAVVTASVALLLMNFSKSGILTGQTLFLLMGKPMPKMKSFIL